MPTIDEQIRALARRCERMLNEEDLRAKLKRSAESGKPLRIKLGMDPTAPDVHLGHAVPLGIVRLFQDWGHKAVIIIGDYTARVGDPTGRNQTRPPLTGEEIDSNAKTYVDQIGKVLLTDPAHLEIRYNSEWLGKMGLIDVIKLASRKSVAQVLAREDFANRYSQGIDIRLHEILYPLLQGWDSVAIEADVEMGGSDQLFNNLVGREFQKEEGGHGQVVMVTPLLVGLDGQKKMSKSLKNYIAVADPPSGPNGMFGKVMKIPDTLMESYYTLLTDIPAEEYKPLIATKPRDAKVRLARHIVQWLHDRNAADAAETEFVRVTHGELPDNIPTHHVGRGPHKLAPILVQLGFAPSNSEANRKIKEGAVSVDDAKFTDPGKEIVVEKPVLVKYGKKGQFATLAP
jgi:tyrosyl-tRNA synthetase